MSAQANGNPLLHALLLDRMAEAGVPSQAAMTIMAPHRDPYRLEKHRPEAEWLAESMERIPHRPVHVRGLHYAAIDTPLPNGNPYMNTEKAYAWMQDKPAKAARWLGLAGKTVFVGVTEGGVFVSLYIALSPRLLDERGRLDLRGEDVQLTPDEARELAAELERYAFRADINAT